MNDVKKYNYIEFYHEQINIQKQIRGIRQNFEAFNIYMPKYQMKIEDMSLAINQIKVDIKERLSSFFVETDHNFTLENYDYITKTLENDSIARIYRQLGPFDYYQDSVPGVILEDLTGGSIPNEQRSIVERFDKRKSGAMYRGEINHTTGKPDGKGIKIYPNGSIYEGYFSEGQCHGLGRGVTSKGEVF